MKNKKTLYLLIPLVGLIWGVVIWKVKDYKPSDSQSAISPFDVEEQRMEDTPKYEVEANYRDPFLRASYTKVASTTRQDKRKANNIKNVKIHSVTGIPKPTGIVYRGLIACDKDRVGMMEIGEKKMLIEENGLVEEYRILSVEPDSLRVLYKEKEFSYGKQ